jgi:hypothetical protein
MLVVFIRELTVERLARDKQHQRAASSKLAFQANSDEENNVMAIPRLHKTSHHHGNGATLKDQTR